MYLLSSTLEVVKDSARRQYMPFSSEVKGEYLRVCVFTKVVGMFMLDYVAPRAEYEVKVEVSL